MATNYLEYNDPIQIVWRGGTSEDPYVDIEESMKVVNGTISLSEIPDDFTHVSIDGYVEVRDRQFIKSSSEFFVNYLNGIISFNSSEEAKTLTVKYKGKGLILYPSSRIYDSNIDPNGSTRPSSPQLGQRFFDTSINKPIWFNGTNWVDAMGATV